MRQHLFGQQEKLKVQESSRTTKEALATKDMEILDSHSKPLREYLGKHIMPVLTQGLIQCCKNKPEDPVDFLAEYLFQHKCESKIE